MVLDVIDKMDTNVTASLLLNEHHAVVSDNDPDPDDCERCGHGAGWVQRTSAGPDVKGHTTQATSQQVQAWIAKEQA